MNIGTTSPLGNNSEQEEDSGQTNEIGVQTLVLTLVSRTRPYSSPRAGNPVVEGSFEDPRILSGDVQCQGSD